jgi:hypothetical protein
MERSGTPQSPVSGAKGRKCAHSTGKIFAGRNSRFKFNHGDTRGFTEVKQDKLMNYLTLKGEVLNQTFE